MQLHVPQGSQIRKVGYSDFESRVIRFYDESDEVILDTNREFEGQMTNYEVPPGQKLIGFNGTLRLKRTLDNFGIITCEL